MSLHRPNAGNQAAAAAAQTSSYGSHGARKTRMPVAPRTTQNIPRSTKNNLPGANSTALSRNEPVFPSSGATSVSAADGTSGNGVRRANVKDSRSIVPRSVIRPFAAHPNTLTSSISPSALTSSSGSRIPVLSGFPTENALGLDNTRKILRRKAPSVEQYVSSLPRSASYPKPRVDATDNLIAKRSSRSLLENTRDSGAEATLGTAASTPALPIMPVDRRSGELPPALIPELKALAAAISPNRAASSTPRVPLVGSPSTQCSGSTGPWSSRNTTPSSVSSCSPGIVQASKIKPTHRKARPPQYTTAERSRLEVTGLPAREGAASSSSLGKPLGDDTDKDILLQKHREQSRRSLIQPANIAEPENSSLKSEYPQAAAKPPCPTPEEPLRNHPAGVIGVTGPLEGPVPNVATSIGEPPMRERPRRPSRKGTADLGLKSSPIVQSNLSPLSVRDHRRRESLDVGSSGQPGQGVTPGRGMDPASGNDPLIQNLVAREQIEPASGSSRLPVVRRIPAPSKHPVSTKDSESKQRPNEAGRSTLGKLTSRLGIFGRRSKVSREDGGTEESRDIRKGPAAGTGHEGYGKYARRGRKYSMGSANSSRDRSRSTNNTPRRPSTGRRNSQGSGVESEIDEFVAQRLQPVTISGGGLPDDRSGSNTPAVWPSSHQAYGGSDSSLDLNRQSTYEPAGSVFCDSRSISATSIATDVPSLMPTHSRPINSSGAMLNQIYPVRTAPSDGYNTSQSSLTPDDDVEIIADQHLGRPTLKDLKRAGKKGSRSRWNVFRKKPVDGQPASEDREQVVVSTSMSVAVAPVPIDKPIPYYAIMDSENENDGEYVLQDLLEQVSDSPSPSSEPYGLGLRQQYGQSVLLPSMPTLRSEALQAAPSSSARLVRNGGSQNIAIPDENPPESMDSKRNRLPQVGRIPRVISRRDRQHKPAVTSFSRPFQRENLPNTPEKSGNYVAERPILGIQTDVLPSRPFSTTESSQPASAPAPSLTTRPLGDFESHRQFILFSGGGTPASSNVNQSDELFAADNYRLPTRHRRHTEEDEIWNEYDDLLDRVMSPTSPETAQPPESSFNRELSPNTATRMAKVRPESHLKLGMLHKTERRLKPIQTSSLAPSQADLDYRLRRSRIVSALHSQSPMSPLSPFSITNYATGSGNHDFASTDSGEGIHSPTAVESGFLSPSAHAHHPAFPKLPEASHHQSTALLDIAERDREGPAGQSDLRFAALMTSRWLSFGRVLFSPVHEMVENSPNQQILIIDGLGNDDWSFYCAVTYPMAVVHDLKETDVAARNRREVPTDSWRSPPNYRRVEIPNLAEPFPFPQSYFAAVVFRFPAATSDTILKMAFSECKRVLVPGGYIELSLLDLDIVNMGTITRHAVRDLKARMIGADLEVSLKPVSDNIQNILGRRGFENLNRCVVGVPVAGKMATSSGSRSSRSSRGSSGVRSREADQGGKNNISDRPRQRGGNFSLSELVSDHSATGDDKITKMVAKVGRWWYTRTYEWAVLQGGDLTKSIWGDKRVLHECKVRGSGFKLLIAYAQKPIETRRRTMSEPVKPTVAVSGTHIMNRFDEG